MALETTFVMIKPDAVQRGLVGEIVARFERKGMKVKAMRLEMPDPKVIEKHYEVHKARPFYAGLVKYMTSGPVVPMMVEGESAIAVARAMMGATNPVQGKPGEIRFDLGQHIGRNIIHGSDSAETAKFELGLWFPHGGAEYKRGGDEFLFE
ncbi:MAG: nucleoside-diphosphate kinase [Thermoplasmata archaeon]|jgi:nucleoside-diphosphate kinase|nr:nucleoside-diphosphate kinase [Thermoplasmata archaeon]